MDIVGRDRLHRQDPALELHRSEGADVGGGAEVFEGVWSLAGSVLHPSDVAAVANRLGIGR